MSRRGRPGTQENRPPSMFKGCVHRFRAHGLRPCPGMTGFVIPCAFESGKPRPERRRLSPVQAKAGLAPLSRPRRGGDDLHGGCRDQRIAVAAAPAMPAAMVSASRAKARLIAAATAAASEPEAGSTILAARGAPVTLAFLSRVSQVASSVTLADAARRREARHLDRDRQSGRRAEPNRWRRVLCPPATAAEAQIGGQPRAGPPHVVERPRPAVGFGVVFEAGSGPIWRASCSRSDAPGNFDLADRDRPRRIGAPGATGAGSRALRSARNNGSAATSREATA